MYYFEIDDGRMQSFLPTARAADLGPHNVELPRSQLIVSRGLENKQDYLLLQQVCSQWPLRALQLKKPKCQPPMALPLLGGTNVKQ